MMMKSLNGTIQNVSVCHFKAIFNFSIICVCFNNQVTSPMSICPPDDSSERGLHPDLQRLSWQLGGVCRHEYKGEKCCVLISHKAKCACSVFCDVKFFLTDFYLNIVLQNLFFTLYRLKIKSQNITYCISQWATLKLPSELHKFNVFYKHQFL